VGLAARCASVALAGPTTPRKWARAATRRGALDPRPRSAVCCGGRVRALGSAAPGWSAVRAAHPLSERASWRRGDRPEEEEARSRLRVATNVEVEACALCAARTALAVWPTAGVVRRCASVRHQRDLAGAVRHGHAANVERRHPRRDGSRDRCGVAAGATHRAPRGSGGRATGWERRASHPHHHDLGRNRRRLASRHSRPGVVVRLHLRQPHPVSHCRSWVAAVASDVPAAYRHANRPVPPLGDPREAGSCCTARARASEGAGERCKERKGHKQKKKNKKRAAKWSAPPAAQVRRTERQVCRGVDAPTGGDREESSEEFPSARVRTQPGGNGQTERDMENGPSPPHTQQEISRRNPTTTHQRAREGTLRESAKHHHQPTCVRCTRQGSRLLSREAHARSNNCKRRPTRHHEASEPEKQAEWERAEKRMRWGGEARTPEDVQEGGVALQTTEE
jgi:hypothetical protein